MSGKDGWAQADVLAFMPSAPQRKGQVSGPFMDWRNRLRVDVLAALADFVAHGCAADMVPAGIDIAADVLQGVLEGGKCVRSTYAYLGWLCGAEEDDAALRASASFELLHAFALMQDDVMDESALRRGRPSAHVIVRVGGTATAG